MPESPFYSEDELRALGATQVGKNAQISRLARFYAFKGSIGERARIDDFAILKGRVNVGSYVHISAFCLLSGVGGTITLKDFSGIAAYTAIYTSSDDYLGPYLSNPIVPVEHTNPFKGDITLGEGSLVGAHSVMVPGAQLGDFATVGALCIINKPIGDGEVMVTGAACRSIAKRDVEALKKRVAAIRGK
ncbi:MAG TPA: acyltransferase [Alphaproteobacteria bacterium]|nr:acyltransferase [Alphaproteobacteria bacterium]